MSFLLKHHFSICYGKVKVKLALCLTKYHAMKTYWGCGGIASRILNLSNRYVYE